MSRQPKSPARFVLPALLLILALVAGPASAQVATDAPATATPSSLASDTAALTLADVPGIVDPDNLDWPREVEGLNGIVRIPAKPLRIITASVGHDEMTLALVPPERLVGVGEASRDATFSNVADLVQDVAVITRDPETIVALEPDVVVTSPWFPADGIDALARADLLVIQTDLAQDPETRLRDILLMGYIYGEEQRALDFAAEVRARHNAVVEVTATAEPKALVLALTQFSDQLWVAGRGSTEGGIIEAAGGINAAAADVEGHQTTSLEGVIAMAPEFIIIAQPLAFGAAEFRQFLLESEVLAEVPAIREQQVIVVDSRHFTTLSWWNLLGIEELARILWPEAFPQTDPLPFSMPG